MGFYWAKGEHADGRTVERTSGDLTALLQDIADDARGLPERRHA